MNPEKTKLMLEVTQEEFDAIFEREANKERYCEVRNSSKVQQYYEDMLKEVEGIFPEHAEDVKEVIKDERLLKGYEQVIKEIIVESALKELVISGNGKTFDEAVLSAITDEKVIKGIDIVEMFITETLMEIFNTPGFVVHVGFVN